jgi:hypothetical protein
MPNHITNILKVNSDNYQEILESLKGEESVDFNTVIPMPEDLINSQSNTEEYLFEKEILPVIPEEYRDTVENRLQYFKENLEILLNPQHDLSTVIQNYIKYGYTSWYPWSIAHWGTKWNAYQCSEGDEPDTIIFQTAWSMPDAFFYALSAKFPDAEFIVEYADEDVGNNCGIATFKNGILQKLWEPSEEEFEHVKFACQVIGYDPDEILKDIQENTP